MRKPLVFKLLHSGAEDKLEDQINNLMGLGYEPSGSPYMYEVPGKSPVYLMGMMRYEEEEKRKVVDYQVVWISQVKENLAGGWELYETPFIIPVHLDGQFEIYQAMVKYEVEKEDE